LSYQNREFHKRSLEQLIVAAIKLMVFPKYPHFAKYFHISHFCEIFNSLKIFSQNICISQFCKKIFLEIFSINEFRKKAKFCKMGQEIFSFFRIFIPFVLSQERMEWSWMILKKNKRIESFFGMKMYLTKNRTRGMELFFD